MKYFFLSLVCLILIVSPCTVFAKQGGGSQGHGNGPHPNASAYEHASDNASFNRGEDMQGGSGMQHEDSEKLLKDDDESKNKKKMLKEKMKNEGDSGEIMNTEQEKDRDRTRKEKMTQEGDSGDNSVREMSKERKEIQNEELTEEQKQKRAVEQIKTNILGKHKGDD